MINQKFVGQLLRIAGARRLRVVVIVGRDDRLNPFNDDARLRDKRPGKREKEGGNIAGGRISSSRWGSPFLGPPREKEAKPLFRQGVSPSCFRRFSPSDLVFVSSFWSLFFFFTFLKERSIAVAHSGNLSLGGVMDTIPCETTNVYIYVCVCADRSARRNVKSRRIRRDCVSLTREQK